jgi:hypothetical protein
MKRKKIVLSILMTAWLITPFVVYAQTDAQPVAQAATASARPLAELLPDALAGTLATADITKYTVDNLAEISGDHQAAFAEYHVRQAASRLYGKLRVEVFDTPNQFTAFGLFSYNAGLGGAKPSPQEVGSGGARAGNDLIFWKDNCFVRVASADTNSARAVTSAQLSLARAVADLIVNENPPLRPRLLESLPAAMAARSERYFLGPESLTAYVEHGRGMFAFAGGAEAVAAEYHRGNRARGTGRAPLKLVIVEYHTPQFATEAMAAATAYVESLPDEERNKIVLKREGNFIVEAASSAEDRAFAQSLVDSVKYPYIVKWLSPLPRMPKEDPLHGQKAAQMLVSTFSLLGLLLGGVFVGGMVFGSMIFFKRRKQQRQQFSDAGGMVRLNLDPFETVILGLPPKRSNED